MIKLLPLVFALLGVAAGLDCDSDRIACSNHERCIPHSFMCDYDDDCDDESDEDYELCDILRSTDCIKGEAVCSRNGQSSCMEIATYCAMSDPPCQGDLDRRVCMMMEAGTLTDLDNFVVIEHSTGGDLNASKELGEQFLSVLPYTLQHEQCPPMYTMIAGSCLSLFHFGSMSWSESREFCRIIGGDLATFSDINQFTSVVKHLQEYEITSDFWVGGMMEDTEAGWTWTDGSPITMGSPFWATRYNEECVNRNVTFAVSEDVCFHYSQAPMMGSRGQCVSLSFEQFFYMNDDDCVKKRSPLCAYMGVDRFAFDEPMPEPESS